MKQLYYILALAACLAIQSSCKTIKHTTDKVAVHDTVRTAIHDTLTQAKDRMVTVYVHDTTITTAGYTVIDTYAAAQLRHPGSYQSSKGNVHSTLTIDTSGNAVVTCQADSLKTVIANLVVRNSVLTDSITSIKRSSTAKTNNTSSSFIQTIKKVRIPVWLWIVAGLIIMIEIVYQVIKFYKKTHLP